MDEGPAVLDVLVMLWAVSLVVLATALALTIVAQGLLRRRRARAGERPSSPRAAALRPRAVD